MNLIYFRNFFHIKNKMCDLNKLSIILINKLSVQIFYIKFI